MSLQIDPSLITHLSQTTGLSSTVCRRLVLDILAEYDETLEHFVVRRHQELKAVQGLKNEAIYAAIREEIPQRRFVISNMTARQIRRLIYG